MGKRTEETEGEEKPVTLHERIAEALKWPLKDVQSMSFQNLRELVRPTHSKLAYLIDEHIRSGDVVIGEPLKRRRRAY
jgi:hypothetical protein